MIETSTLILETQCQWFEPRRLRQMLLSVDGAGSGLDADTVDGLHAASFVLKAGDTMTGNLIVNGSNTISVGADTDSLHILGRAKVGYVGHGDYAAFSHYDNGTILNYALLQHATGQTYLNAANGSPIRFRINNSTFMHMSNVGLRIGSDVAPIYTLDVTGTMCISGNVGFFSVTPAARPAAYTQTYATATRTHAAVTSTAPSAYAAGANGYSTGAKASEVHAAVIASRNDIINIKQVLNQVIDDLQAYGLLQ